MRNAWTFFALLLVALTIAGTIEASPPPRTAQPVSRARVHQRVRLLYLKQACYPLDYWHVICPEPAP